MVIHKTVSPSNTISDYLTTGEQQHRSYQCSYLESSGQVKARYCFPDSFKGHVWYYEHWAPFLWVVDTEMLVLSLVLGSFRIADCKSHWNRNRLEPVSIYKMPNKTQKQKLYFATILDLEHQQTPLPTLWVAHLWKLTFRVILKTAIVKQAGAILNGPIVNISVSTTLFQYRPFYL